MKKNIFLLVIRKRFVHEADYDFHLMNIKRLFFFFFKNIIWLKICLGQLRVIEKNQFFFFNIQVNNHILVINMCKISKNKSWLVSYSTHFFDRL